MTYPRSLRLTFAALFLGLTLAACGNPEQREANYLKRGNKLFEKGEYQKARIEYKNAGRIKPADPEVAYRLGLVDEAESDFRDAFEDFTHSEQQNAHFRPALLKLAEYYVAGEQYDQAQIRIDKVLADAPDDPEAHAIHAAILLRQKDFAGTEKEARFALGKDPANIVAFSVLAGLYAAKGDDTQALTAVEDGIAHNPKSLPLLLLRAQICERAGNLAKTDESYQAIFKLAPKDFRYRVNLAAIYLKAGKIDEAEATLRAGVAALPDDWDLKHQLVTFLSDHRGLDAAEAELRSYMKKWPERTDLTMWLVDLYISHDAIDRAIALLNDVIAKNQLDTEGLAGRMALARIDYIKGDKEAAGKLAATVLEKDPNNIDALFIKAHIEFDNGFYQNAVADLRAIIRDHPKARDALHLLSETLLLQGHLNLAIDTLGQLIELDPLNMAARVRLAQMVHLNGDSRHAMDLLFFVTKTDPKYSVGWETTARVAIDIKDWPTAETAIQNLDNLDGQHMTAVFLRGQLLAANGKAEDAIAQYKQVIDADPSTPLAERALASLVVAYRSLNRANEATDYIESLKTKNPVVSTILGESYLAAGNTGQAATDFDAAIAGNASRPEPYLDRARMFVYDHKTDQALDTLRKGASAAPADLRAPLMEAQILGDLGRYQEAITLYEDLLARNPDLDAVANNLAEIIADYDYTDQAALEKAGHVAERFAAMSNPLFLDTLAWVYYRQNNIQEAQAVMQRAMSANDKIPPQIHYHYGAILMKAGKVPEAKAELQKSVAGGTNYPGLDDAKKLLQGL